MRKWKGEKVEGCMVVGRVHGGWKGAWWLEGCMRVDEDMGV